jgi:pSer/pThr/pTyr-binding forkhead associated (FHA) protein
MSSYSVYGIGRNPDADIQIEHSSVSRSHAELVVTADGKFYISDCNSSGGTAIRKSSTEPWEKTRQGYVAKTDAVLLGGYVTSVQELLLEIKDSAKGQHGRTGKKGGADSEWSSKDDLPEGPVRRDAITGEILKQGD